jgi:WD40 repeat protein
MKGQSIITAGDDGTARIWDAGTGTLIDVLRGHADSVSAARLSRDGSMALTASVDGTARLWPLAQRRLLATVPSNDGGFSSVEFSHDGTRIIAATRLGSQPRNQGSLEVCHQTRGPYQKQLHERKVHSVCICERCIAPPPQWVSGKADFEYTRW